MSGHSHWKQIKQKKGSEDQKRARAFSKLLSAIAVAARAEQNPQFNPRLRAAIEKAKRENVPQDNIDRAIQRSSKDAADLEEITLEAYGPGNAAILIDAITDNRNRTINEVKQILKDLGGKWADQGSVRWAFENTAPKFPQRIEGEDRKRLSALVEALEEQDDVQSVYHNGVVE